MSHGERFSNVIGPTPEIAAKNFCFFIQDAAEKVRHADSLQESAQNYASRLIGESMFSQLPFRLEIMVPTDVEAYVVRDDQIIEEQPEKFIASEIRGISRHGVEFYDRETDSWLRIRGHQFTIEPSYPESEPTPEP